MTEAWPTEHAATVAVDAAARAAYEADVEQRRKVFPPGVRFRTWEQYPADKKLEIRQAVLPIVWAALAALPDPRHGAWAEGREAGYDDAMYEERGVGPYPAYPHKNPYPSGL